MAVCRCPGTRVVITARTCPLSAGSGRTDGPVQQTASAPKHKCFPVRHRTAYACILDLAGGGCYYGRLPMAAFRGETEAREHDRQRPRRRAPFDHIVRSREGLRSTPCSPEEVLFGRVVLTVAFTTGAAHCVLFDRPRR
ncbi:hypothetical protein MRX96_032217 [Rhipicephalus microplus]